MDELAQQVCTVVTDTLKEQSGKDALSSEISVASSMDTITEWDSLSFVSVYLSVSEHFEMDVEEDDAIQFVSIQGILDLIEEIRESA